MLAIRVPSGTSRAAFMFLQGWSLCMSAMTMMDETAKRQVEDIFKKHIEPQAQCPELKELDKALITYLLHKCDAPERVGSLAPKGEA